MSTPHNVGILIFEGVELLDFAGPFEVFSAARPASASTERLLNVFTVAEEAAPVTCNNPVTVLPAYTLADCPSIDILVVPGGRGTRTAIDRPELIAWIADRAAKATLTTSVCTGRNSMRSRSPAACTTPMVSTTCRKMRLPVPISSCSSRWWLSV